jgi:stringent starvation protein B
VTSSRPYLIRAIYQWILDNACTPQLVVDASVEGVEIPRDFVEDGRIVLNISATAVRGLSLGDRLIAFNARFGGTPFHVSLPVRSVLAMIARENGAGMSFPPDEPESEPPGGDSPGSPDEPSGRRDRPALRVVK